VVEQKIISFMPELSDINLRRKIHGFSKLKGWFTSAPINLNKAQIARLSKSNIEVINKHLKNNEDVLKFFGYNLI
jgi:hypothetical protein